MSRASQVPLRQLVSNVARAISAAQQGLDARGDESLRQWEQEGLPPTGFTWSTWRLRFPVDFLCQPRRAASEQSALSVAPRHISTGTVRMTLRYRPPPSE